MDEQKPKGEVNIDNIIRGHEEETREMQRGKYVSGERGEQERRLNWLTTVFLLAYAAGFVLLVLVPFVDWITLLDATCVFVIGACFLAVYRQMEDLKLGNERYIIWCRLLQEIRDAVKESKGDDKSP